ncbi:MAG: M91 family zinc metallopeptidase [Polyangia bacterium]
MPQPLSQRDLDENQCRMPAAPPLFTPAAPASDNVCRAPSGPVADTGPAPAFTPGPLTNPAPSASEFPPQMCTLPSGPGAAKGDKDKPGATAASTDLIPDNFVGPLQEGQHRVSDLSVDKPTVMNHGMGPVQVYPDDFVGPLPPGAMSLKDYKKRIEVYSEIAHGTSQISVDTSNFMVGADGKPLDPKSKEYAEAKAKADAFRAQTMGNLGELLRTDHGYDFMSDLGSAKHHTRIQHGTALSNETGYEGDTAARFLGDDKKPGAGCDAVISINPDLKTFAGPGEKEDPWMTERPKYGLYHEMIHAYHAVHGDTVKGKHNGINEREFQAAGLGPYAKEKFSENSIRKAMGKEERPHYSGVHW